jgi:hypothetical protein
MPSGVCISIVLSHAIGLVIIAVRQSSMNWGGTRANPARREKK